MARPTLQNPERLAAILRSKRNGDTDLVAATAGGVSDVTLYAWLRGNDDFREAFAAAQILGDAANLNRRREPARQIVLAAQAALEMPAFR